jgi:hypothetical protein
VADDVIKPGLFRARSQEEAGNALVEAMDRIEKIIRDDYAESR